MVKKIVRIVLVIATALVIGGLGPGLAYAHNITQNLGNYTVPAGQTVKGNINLNVGNVLVRGTVDGNVDVNVGNVVVSGLVKGNVHVHTGNIRVNPGGHVNGLRTVDIGNAASGPVPGVFSAPSQWSEFIPGGAAAWDWMNSPWIHVGRVAQFLGKLFINVLVSAVLIVLFPRMIRQIVQGMSNVPVRSAAVGCLSLVAWVVAMLGLAVIVIGIPLSLLLALGGAVAALLANGAAVWLVGSRLKESAWASEVTEWYWIVILGGVVVTLVEMIPVIGQVAELAVVVIGIGAIVQSRLGFLSPPTSG